MAKKGVMRGLPRNEAMTDQSRVKAPMPRPRIPDPICWAVIEFGNTQHTQLMVPKVGKRYPGTTYQEKLQMSAIKKNFALVIRFLSFS